VNAVPVLCAIASLPVGWFGGVLFDRIPDQKPLWPLPKPRLAGWNLFILVFTFIGFVLMGFRFEHAPFLLLVGYLLLTAALVTLSAIDIDCYRLPDRIVLPSFLISLVIVVVESLRTSDLGRVRYAAAGAAIYFGFLLLVHLISPNGMGFGDVKLALLMGLYAGWLAVDYTGVVVLVLWCMLVGFVGGSIVGIALFASRGGRSRHIPFGPFLAVGCLTTILLASHLTNVHLTI